MKQFRQWLITVLSAFPFARYILKGLYLLAIKGARSLTDAHPEIVDIYLMSNLEDKNFVYGQSDLNMVFILRDDSRPRATLSKIKKSLRQSWPANVLIDLNRLPILKESEFKTPVVRSHLVTGTNDGNVSWKSLVTGEFIKFKAGKQGMFAKHYFYIERIEKYLSKDLRLRPVGKHYIRSYGKNITRSLEGLAKDAILPPITDQKWRRQGKKLFSFSPFARFYFSAHKERSWRLLDIGDKSFEKLEKNPSIYPERLLEFADKLCSLEIVEDVLITPSLLQNTERAKGKAFIDVVIGGEKKTINRKDIKRVLKQIDDFLERESKEEEPELKYEMNLTTNGFLEIRHQRGLFHYPLEGWYRRQKTFSAMGRKREFQINLECVEQSMVHFLLIEFMRFRSQKISTSLIGSKFMKSLNLMNRYNMILDYLAGQPLTVPERYADMMSNITPQLGHYRPQMPVHEEDWPLIKSQLIYSLKKIRDELAKTRPSLKNLQF